MADIFYFFIYVLLGVSPSLIWLLFYLHKDSHPEPKSLVLKVFILGALFAGPMAILMQLFFLWLSQPSWDFLSFLHNMAQRNWRFFFNILVIAPLTEEFLKYAVVHWQILKNPAFDEPLDAMLYLIISALGFAAIENITNIFFLNNLTLNNALANTLARFLSATLLHTLTSGLLGYFLAKSLFDFKKRFKIFFSGLFLAIAAHSFYNFLAWQIDENKLIGLGMAIFLGSLIALVSWQFYLLKKQITICKI